MKSITVGFVDFWSGFDSNNNFLLRALQNKYDVTVLESPKESPDFLFCSAFGHKHFQYPNSIKIYFTGENDVPNFNYYDYALSFQEISFNGRHLRYPLYHLYCDISTLDNPLAIPDDSSLLNRDFCSIVVSNAKSSTPMREEIWRRLEQYKPVSSGGRYKNNVGGPVADKEEFIKRYKFNLALENSQVDGYTTEKIVEPFLAFTVPIYWGNRHVGKEFNKEAFIDISDFATLDNAIDHIRAIDDDDDAYLKMLHAPKLTIDNAIDWNERLSEFLCRIIDQNKKQAAQYGHSRDIVINQQIKEQLYSTTLLRKVCRHYLNFRNKKRF